MTTFNRSKALDYSTEYCKQNPVIFSIFGNGQATHEPLNHRDFEYISICTFACISATAKLKNYTKENRIAVGGVVASKQTKRVSASGIFSELDGLIIEPHQLIEAIADIAAAHGYIVLKSRNDGYTYRIR